VGWGDSSKSRVGDWILAIGNPYGLENTVTVGIISARGRVINAGPYDDFLQTDASIKRGNSGGPMFNVDGQVIGINTAIFSPSGGSVGIGFAIPAALAKPLIDQLIEYGRPRRGWLGVRIQTVTDEIAEGLGLAEAKGALVAGVTDDGPAKGAGIEPGDVILTFDAKDVVEMRKLPRLVAETKIGKEVAVKVWRKGKMVTLGVVLGELPEDDQKVASIAPAAPKATTESMEALGLTLSAISDELREKHSLGEALKGVVVTAVAADSSAAEKGIREGDVIVEVSQEEVATPGEVIEKVRKVQDSNRKSVLLLVQSGENLRFVAVRLDNS
jgi:serine protease Do